MNKITKYLIAAAGAALSIAACSKWTEVEVKHPSDLSVTNRTAEYYEQLRAYKQSDHQVAFGWFGNWVGNGVSLENSLAGLPDSVDFVSLWGNWQNPGPERLADFQRTRELKGTKALICFLVFDIGDQITPAMPDGYPGSDAPGFDWKHEFWGWGETLEDHIAATENYAKALLDTIAKYDYDGFDIDAEPSYAQPFATKKELWTNPELMEAFVKTLATELGPKSGTDKMLVIDGEPHALAAEYGEYFDYFILQAYTTSGVSNLDGRVSQQIQHFAEYLTPEEVAKKIIVCENFEDYAQAGGYNFTDRYGNQYSSFAKDASGEPLRMKSLEGMAGWSPLYNGQTLRKGGIGTYHMEYEYKVSGFTETYPYMRNCIQIMNPVIY